MRHSSAVVYNLQKVASCQHETVSRVKRLEEKQIVSSILKAEGRPVGAHPRKWPQPDMKHKPGKHLKLCLLLKKSTEVPKELITILITSEDSVCSTKCWTIDHKTLDAHWAPNSQRFKWNKFNKFKQKTKHFWHTSRRYWHSWLADWQAGETRRSSIQVGFYPTGSRKMTCVCKQDNRITIKLQTVSLYTQVSRQNISLGLDVTLCV